MNKLTKDETQPEPFPITQSLPCRAYVTTMVRTTLEIRPMTLAELHTETGIPQECLLKILSDNAIRGRDSLLYYLRKVNSFCMRG